MSEEDVLPSRSARLAANALWIAVLVVVSATPMIIDRSGRDVFRVPKSAFFQASMIAIGAITAAAALLVDGFARRFLRHRGAVTVAIAATVWVAVVSMTAVVPTAAHAAPLSMFCHAILFVITVALARDRRLLPAAAALMLPAMVNATIVLLQAFNVWQPFVVQRTGRFVNIGLIGNANTAGTYLLFPAVAALAVAVAVPRYRIAGTAIAALLVAAIFQVQTISVLVALAAALLAFVIRGTRRARIAAVAAVGVVLIAVAAFGPLRQRLALMARLAKSGNYSALTSGRIPAAATALKMFRDRPLVGLGPGGFAARYMPYRLRVEEDNPQWIREVRESFGEAHNDHAQVLAETGVPGYALFLLFLLSVARLTFRRRTSDDERSRFVRTFALPAASAFAVVALGQFPLELSAITSSCVFAAGICFAWSDDARG